MLGGPGSGKGTQCQRIAKAYGFEHLSAGTFALPARLEGGCQPARLWERGVVLPNHMVQCCEQGRRASVRCCLAPFAAAPVAGMIEPRGSRFSSMPLVHVGLSLLPTHGSRPSSGYGCRKMLIYRQSVLPIQCPAEVRPLRAGDLLRADVERGGPQAAELQRTMKEGELVPDQTMITLLKVLYLGVPVPQGYAISHGQGRRQTHDRPHIGRVSGRNPCLALCMSKGLHKQPASSTGVETAVALRRDVCQTA